MMIVKYAGTNVEMANGTGWTMFITGMEGLLVDQMAGVNEQPGPTVIWREILIKVRATEPWRLFQYMPASIEFNKVVVTGYAEDAIAWKQSHVPAVPWPPWLKERTPDPPDRSSRRDK